MRLEGTLDAFSLPDIFQLLSFTKKTGTLHLRRDRDGESLHGVVHLRDGAVTGGRGDIGRQELGRRLLGAGLIGDEVLAAAAEDLSVDPALSLAKRLAERAELDPEVVRDLATEQVTDTVFTLLRWPNGEFAFVMDEPDLDDLGASLPVDTLVAEAERRVTVWSELVASVPAPDAVVLVNSAPGEDPTASREEWSLLALVDGRRTVADLVALSGRGEYSVVSALAGLIQRGLLVVRPSAADAVLRRQSLLSTLEGRPIAAEPEPEPAPVPLPPAPRQQLPTRPVAPVIPERPEPFTATRRPDHAEPAPAYARASVPVPTSRPTTAGGGHHGSVSGATALQPEAAADPAAATWIERDPSVNKSLLLRLIAGVRGL